MAYKKICLILLLLYMMSSCKVIEINSLPDKISTKTIQTTSAFATDGIALVYCDNDKVILHEIDGEPIILFHADYYNSLNRQLDVHELASDFMIIDNWVYFRLVNGIGDRIYCKIDKQGDNLMRLFSDDDESPVNHMTYNDGYIYYLQTVYRQDDEPFDNFEYGNTFLCRMDLDGNNKEQVMRASSTYGLVGFVFSESNIYALEIQGAWDLNSNGVARINKIDKKTYENELFYFKEYSTGIEYFTYYDGYLYILENVYDSDPMEIYQELIMLSEDGGEKISLIRTKTFGYFMEHHYTDNNDDISAYMRGEQIAYNYLEIHFINEMLYLFNGPLIDRFDTNGLYISSTHSYASHGFLLGDEYSDIMGSIYSDIISVNGDVFFVLQYMERFSEDRFIDGKMTPMFRIETNRKVFRAQDLLDFNSYVEYTSLKKKISYIYDFGLH